MGKNIAWVLVLILISGKSAYGEGPGTAAGKILQLGMGARAAGMGNAYTAISDDVTAMYWNVGGLVRIYDPQISFMQSYWLADVSYNYLGGVLPTRVGRIGFMLNYLSAGRIQKYDRFGYRDEGAYAPTDLVLNLSWATRYRPLPELSYGVNLKYLSSKIDTDNGTAVAADIGLFYRPMDRAFSAGLAVKNLGTAMKYIKESYPLPASITGGIALIPAEHLLCGIDIDSKITEKTISVRLGGEYIYYASRVKFAVRGGYQTDMINGLGGNSGLAVGFGIGSGGKNLDYAWSPDAGLGSIQKISFSLFLKR